MGTLSERRRRSDGDGTGTHRKSCDEFKAWFPYDHNSGRFHMSPTDRGHVAEASPTVTIIWKPGFMDGKLKFVSSHSVRRNGMDHSILHPPFYADLKIWNLCCYHDGTFVKKNFS